MKFFSFLLFLLTTHIQAQDLNSLDIEKSIKSLNKIDKTKNVEQQIAEKEKLFFEDVKALQGECEQNFLTVRLGKKVSSSKARLTRKEKQMCLSKASSWSRRFREAKFEIRKEALKYIMQDQAKALEKMKNNALKP